jgi:hypothetical protein
MDTNPHPDYPANDPEDTNDPPADNRGSAQNRPPRRTPPPDIPAHPSPHNRRTLMDNDFANRAQVRRHRQPTSPFSTQRIESISGGSENTRKLLIAGAALLGLALLFLLFRVFSGFLLPAVDTAVLPSPSPGVTASPAPLAGVGEDRDASPEAATSTDTSDSTSPSPAPTGDTFVVSGTEGAGLRLRAEPSTEAEVIGTLDEGAEVEATGEQREEGGYLWRRVQTPQGDGWVADEFLAPASSAGTGEDRDADAGSEAPAPTSEPASATSPSPTPTGDMFVVSGTEGDGLRLRESPSATAEVIDVLPEGTLVEATGDQSEEEGRLWRRVQAPQGDGWVADEFLAPAPQ